MKTSVYDLWLSLGLLICSEACLVAQLVLEIRIFG